MAGEALTDIHRRGRWLRLGRRLGGERLLFLAARLLYRLRIEGQDHLPARGACLFAYNHVSQPADLLVNALIRRRRPDLYFFAAQGWQAQSPLAAFLEGGGEPDAGQRLLRAYKARGLSAGELLRAYRLLLDGGAISIAPEGEITWDGRLQRPLLPGTAWLALRAGAPVIPVVSIGGYDLQPRWQMERIRWTGRLTIRAGRPLLLSSAPVIHPTDAVLTEAGRALWEAMAALISR